MAGVNDLDIGTIRIDSREANAHPTLSSDLRAKARDAKVTVVSDLIMVFGDYGFKAPHAPWIGRSPTIGIELCTVSDLCGKVDSGRLAYQLSGLISEFDVPHLLVESPIIRSKDGMASAPPGYLTSGVSYDRLWSVLYAAQCHGVIVRMCADRASTASTIWSMYRYWMHPYEDHKLFRPQEAPKQRIALPLGKALDSHVSFLMGLPNVGEDKAVKALETAKSVSNLLDMTPEMMSCIPMWGNVTATKVREFLDARFY